MTPFICFIHIGKNGGTTFHQILHNNIPRFFSIPYHTETRGQFNSVHLDRFIRVTAANGVGGHTVKPYLDYESIIKRPIFYITFLREPVKRYISIANYRMYRRWSPDIEHTFGVHEYQDSQVRHLVGERDLAKACNMLHKIDFVGIVEEYDLSLLLLRQKLQPYFDLQVYYEKENVAEERSTNYYDKSSLSEAHLRRIRTENALDIELYMAGLARVDQMKANYRGDLQADLAAFRHNRENYRRPRLNRYVQKAKNGLVARVVQPLVVRL